MKRSLHRVPNEASRARTARFDQRSPAFVDVVRIAVDGNLAGAKAIIAASRIVVESTR